MSPREKPEKRERDPAQYRTAWLRSVLAQDPRTAELGVEMNVRGDHVYLSGDVVSARRKEQVCQVIREAAPGAVVHDDLHVTGAGEPRSTEDLS